MKLNPLILAVSLLFSGGQALADRWSLTAPVEQPGAVSVAQSTSLPTQNSGLIGPGLVPVKPTGTTTPVAVPVGGKAASEKAAFEPIGVTDKVGGAKPKQIGVPLKAVTVDLDDEVAGGGAATNIKVGGKTVKAPSSGPVEETFAATTVKPKAAQLMAAGDRKVDPPTAIVRKSTADPAAVGAAMFNGSTPILPGFGADNTAMPIELPGVGPGGSSAAMPPQFAARGQGASSAAQSGMAAQIKRMQDEAVSGKTAYIQAKQGVTELVPISKGQLNRIVTTFDKPNGLTVAPNTKVSVVGKALFVATGSDEPIGLFITDELDSDKAVSLTLIPSDIPPREIFISLLPNQEMSSFNAAQARVGKQAETNEAQAFVDQMKTTMRELALGKLPAGFALSDHSKDASYLRCPQMGFRTTLGQTLEGPQNLRIAVFLASNVSGQVETIDEQGCYRKGVKAVAAWPKIVVEPGQDTEIFVVMQREEEVVDAYSSRPSLLKGRR